MLIIHKNYHMAESDEEKKKGKIEEVLGRDFVRNKEWERHESSMTSLVDVDLDRIEGGVLGSHDGRCEGGGTQRSGCCKGGRVRPLGCCKGGEAWRPRILWDPSYPVQHNVESNRLDDAVNDGREGGWVIGDEIEGKVDFHERGAQNAKPRTNVYGPAPLTQMGQAHLNVKRYQTQLSSIHAFYYFSCEFVNKKTYEQPRISDWAHEPMVFDETNGPITLDSHSTLFLTPLEPVEEILFNGGIRGIHVDRDEGAVSAALEVVESVKWTTLSRKKLQGQQLVKIAASIPIERNLALKLVPQTNQKVSMFKPEINSRNSRQQKQLAVALFSVCQTESNLASPLPPLEPPDSSQYKNYKNFDVEQKGFDPMEKINWDQLSSGWGKKKRLYFGKNIVITKRRCNVIVLPVGASPIHKNFGAVCMSSSLEKDWAETDFTLTSPKPISGRLCGGGSLNNHIHQQQLICLYLRLWLTPWTKHFPVLKRFCNFIGYILVQVHMLQVLLGYYICF